MKSEDICYYEVPAVGDYSDLLAKDFTHVVFQKQISGILKHEYLAPYQNDENEIKGILYGPYARPLICLPVTRTGQNVQKESLGVHFLINTGAPTTYLSKKALMTLFNVKDSALIESMAVDIWGTKIAVSVSTNQLDGVNLLGADYLRKANIKLDITYDNDFEADSCSLNKRKLKQLIDENANNTNAVSKENQDLEQTRDISKKNQHKL